MKASELDTALRAVRSNTWLDSDCITAAAASSDAVASQRRHGCDDSSLATYYEDSHVRIYHGDCRNYERLWFGLLLTDPPYPNGEGHFDDAVPLAREVIHNAQSTAKMVFWSELETPDCGLPHVATHIWHRTNVNGKIYEPCYEYNAIGAKRRSDVIRGAAIFKGAGAGCCEYLGHPTQKPLHVIRRLIEISRTEGTIFDPFMGSGTTLRAAKDLGRKAIGIEIEERYCEISVEFHPIGSSSSGDIDG